MPFNLKIKNYGFQPEWGLVPFNTPCELMVKFIFPPRIQLLLFPTSLLNLPLQVPLYGLYIWANWMFSLFSMFQLEGWKLFFDV